MKLTDLEAKFVRLDYVDVPDHGRRQTYKEVDTIAEAQGLVFLCPGCYRKNGNSKVGTHSIIIWSRCKGVPDEVTPGPGRWTLHGAGLDDLSVQGDPIGSARSISLSCWHGYIDRGEAHE